MYSQDTAHNIDLYRSIDTEEAYRVVKGMQGSRMSPFRTQFI